MIYIAPGITSHQWCSLSLDDPQSSDWNTAITIFRSRIADRFLDPIRLILEAEESVPAPNRRFGFAIMALDCLLVETLQAFAGGHTSTRNKSKQLFCDFLRTRDGFKQSFSGPRAENFYYDFRCGILHHAEIGRGSRVWSTGPLVRETPNGLTVNRTDFHHRLVAEYDAYVEQLRDPTNSQSRRLFRKKMTFIARC